MVNAYLKEEPIPIIDALVSGIELFQNTLFITAYGYSEVDADDDAHVSTEFLADIYSSYDNRDSKGGFFEIPKKK